MRVKPRRRNLSEAAVVAVAVLILLPGLSRSEAADKSSLRSINGMKLKASANGRYFVDQDGKPFFNRPLRASKNPNYFEDASGNPLILCGSHTWNTLQDWGTNGSPQPVDLDAYVGFLKAHGHNFTLLWYVELPKFRGLPC
jgi:hypothetical protein